LHEHSLDLDDKPIIAPNYLSTESDRAIAVEAIEIARKIFAQPPFHAHSVQEHVPGAEKQSYEDLVKAAGGKQADRETDR
jgi:choline dehydrogenase